MDFMKINLYGKETNIEDKFIVSVKAGSALLTTGRTHKVICDCFELNKFESIEADEETNIPESYIVCDNCNRSYYVKDLNPE